MIGYGINGMSDLTQATIGHAIAAADLNGNNRIGINQDNFWASSLWADVDDSAGSNTNAIPTAILATADSGRAVEAVTDSGDAVTGNSLTGIGVEAEADMSSGTPGQPLLVRDAYAMSAESQLFANGLAAFRVDVTNYSAQHLSGGLAMGYGILGTADTSTVAYFVNQSATNVTFHVQNTASSGTAHDSGNAVHFENDSNANPTLWLANSGSGGLTNYSTPATRQQLARLRQSGQAGVATVLRAEDAGGVCGIGAGSLSCTGQVKTLVTTADNRTVETYAVHAAENWMEDFGTGTLTRGVALVRLDPAFAQTIAAEASYHVFLTPRGDSKSLYVINAKPGSFEVRESGGGVSSLEFDYRIAGRQLDPGRRVFPFRVAEDRPAIG